MKEATFSLFVSDEARMLIVGAALAKACNDTGVIFLYGNLGAGKTTLARGFLRGLGYNGIVKSPTYTIVESYDFNACSVYHFDFYRIKDMQELDYIGIQDYFISQAVCLIEWPENGGQCLPSPDLSCYIQTINNGREIKFVTHSVQGQEILKRFQHETN